jgi:hypothetical protein
MVWGRGEEPNIETTPHTNPHKHSTEFVCPLEMKPGFVTTQTVVSISPGHLPLPWCHSSDLITTVKFFDYTYKS